MKHFFSKTILLILCSSIFSCQPQTIEPPVDKTGTTRPSGMPVADAVTQTIGPSGGTIVSEDGKMEVEIPAGALTQDVDISIQPIKNTAAGGIGFGYRLLPHGKIFQKKVTLRFRYGNEVRRLSNKEALAIAFQDDKGVWTCVNGTANDTIGHTVTVQSEHFSDWGLIPSLELTPVVKTIGLSESLTLKAVQYVFPVGEDLIVKLGNATSANGGLPEKIDPKYIVRWTLNGPGKIEGKGAEAVYTAPSAKPVQKTATVVCELNVKGIQILLISTIYLIDEGISLSIDGSDWKTYPAMAIAMPALKQYHLGILRTSTDIPEIVLQWPMVTGKNANGMYGWNMLGDEENHVVFEYAEANLQQMYVSVYDDGLGNHDSPGFLSVEEKEEGGKKYITGVFALDKAGLLDNANGQQIKVSSIAGTYKVQRNW